MKLLHLNTLTMNLCPDGLRWQRFTGVMIGSRMLGVFRGCDIDHETALVEYERTWGSGVRAGSGRDRQYPGTGENGGYMVMESLVEVLADHLWKNRREDGWREQYMQDAKAVLSLVRQHEASVTAPENRDNCVTDNERSIGCEESDRMPARPDRNPDGLNASGERVQSVNTSVVALDAATKHAIADNITVEGRSKTDVVQDVWDDIMARY